VCLELRTADGVALVIGKRRLDVVSVNELGHGRMVRVATPI
jgi:hypothetical protein